MNSRRLKRLNLLASGRGSVVWNFAAPSQPIESRRTIISRPWVSLETDKVDLNCQGDGSCANASKNFTQRTSRFGGLNSDRWEPVTVMTAN
jgi:hypothetical protein